MTPSIQVVGAGPAGSSAAITALKLGAAVTLHEKSRFPRHKVCGEFLSPEVTGLLESAGVRAAFEALHPAIVRRLVLHFKSSEKRSRLAEPAFGLSRYAFDDLLFRRALELGAKHEPGAAPPDLPGRVILAHGRKMASTRGNRLFGFKAHFEGPVDDAIELFFFGRCYAGINAVEGGATNVCGLAPEAVLRSFDFDVDRVIASCEKLAERLRPLRRKMKWLTAGPLIFENHFDRAFEPPLYPAGDALSFVDPFTGSGMLSALISGRLAGEAAARGTPSATYIADCRQRLKTPFQISTVCRKLLERGWAERLASWVPGRILVRLTRPRRMELPPWPEF